MACLDHLGIEPPQGIAAEILCSGFEPLRFRIGSPSAIEGNGRPIKPVPQKGPDCLDLLRKPIGELRPKGIVLMAAPVRETRFEEMDLHPLLQKPSYALAFDEGVVVEASDEDLPDPPGDDELRAGCRPFAPALLRARLQGTVKDGALLPEVGVPKHRIQYRMLRVVPMLERAAFGAIGDPVENHDRSDMWRLHLPPQHNLRFRFFVFQVSQMDGDLLEIGIDVTGFEAMRMLAGLLFSVLGKGVLILGVFLKGYFK